MVELVKAIADKILGFLANLHLTLTQWLLSLMAATIGVLLVALKLQGSELHKAQVQLLLSKWDLTNKEDDAKVGSAKAAFQQALKEYDDAKKN